MGEDRRLNPVVVVCCMAFFLINCVKIFIGFYGLSCFICLFMSILFDLWLIYVSMIEFYIETASWWFQFRKKFLKFDCKTLIGFLFANVV